MENTERNKNIEKLMAHDDEAIRINRNNVSHADRAQYIDAKAYRYKIYATIITIIGVIIGAGLIIGGICIGINSQGNSFDSLLVMAIIGIIIIIVAIVVGQLIYTVARNKITIDVHQGAY